MNRRFVILVLVFALAAIGAKATQVIALPDQVALLESGPTLDHTTPAPRADTSVAPLADNPVSPTQSVKLIFIHHSTGGNWLADPNGEQAYGGLGRALMENNYFVSATNYGWGPDEIGSRTDIGYWWDWFRGGNADNYMTALYNENGQNFCNPVITPPYECFGEWPRLATTPSGPNEIVMFKGCFPNAHLSGNPTDQPNMGNNPLRGQDAWVWNDEQGKSVPNPNHTVSNAKGIYNDLLVYFAAHQEKLFVVITGPPLLTDDMGFPTDAAHAANYRAFNEWLVNDWLDGYTHNNVAVFDYYNVLTSNGGDPDTNDAGQSGGNHHRWWNGAVQYVSPVDNDLAAYATSRDSHPTTAGHQKATAEFVPLLNVFYNRWKGGAPPTQSALTLTQPNGGENWPTGSQQSIRWTTTGVVTQVNLYYSTDNFAHHLDIASNITNTNAYTWTTPIITSTSVKVRVESVISPTTVYDVSDANFTLSMPGALDKFVYLPLVLHNYAAAPPACAAPLTGVTISGPTTGDTNTNYTFTAAPTPPGATLPIAYTWSPAPNSGQSTASASYQWDTTGNKIITVTASNCGGTAHDVHTITISAASTTTIRPFPDTTVGIHVFNDQLASSMSEEQFQFAATHYAGTQKMTRSDANHLRTYNPNFVILHYRLGMGLGYRVVQTGCAPTGDWLQIIEGNNWVQEWPGDANVSENWFYHWPETSTTRVLNCDWGWYLMKLDDSSWRTFWSGEVLRQLQANDDDGIFADSFSVPNYLGHNHYNPNLPQIDNTFESQWATRLENFMTYVQQGSLANYHFIPNAGELVTSRETTDYSIADGVMVEGFGGGGDAGYYDLADWQLQMNRVLSLNQDKNKAILAEQYVNADDVNHRMFLLGSYLLIKGRYTYINLELGEAPEWFPEYGIPIGSPTGGAPANIDALWNAGWGVYTRTYSNGLVLVNPTTTSQVVNLGSTFYQATPNGGGFVPANGDVSAWTVSYASVTNVTLAPNRAAVLLNSAP